MMQMLEDQTARTLIVKNLFKREYVLELYENYVTLWGDAVLSGEHKSTVQSNVTVVLIWHLHCALL